MGSVPYHSTSHSSSLIQIWKCMLSCNAKMVPKKLASIALSVRLDEITATTAIFIDINADYPKAKWYQNPKDFFADPAIDLVIVCTHHDTHAEFAEMALNAGKHGKLCSLRYIVSESVHVC